MISDLALCVSSLLRVPFRLFVPAGRAACTSTCILMFVYTPAFSFSTVWVQLRYYTLTADVTLMDDACVMLSSSGAGARGRAGRCGLRAALSRVSAD